jgi:uncharacterized protein YprB with RNaseH-like and TPR domain
MAWLIAWRRWKLQKRGRKRADFLFLDAETTGLDDMVELIEIA